MRLRGTFGGIIAGLIAEVAALVGATIGVLTVIGVYELLHHHLRIL